MGRGLRSDARGEEGKEGGHIVALHGEKKGEGKGTDGWAGATMPQFE
jgi:hypothetical protein